MGNLKDFAKRMKKHGRTVQANSTKAAITTAGVIVQTVTLATPVDEGTARGNWFASLGSPNLQADEAFKDKSGQTTISIAKQTISKKIPEQPIYITNNLPYIDPLNKGHSSQAPAGFVEKAVLVGKTHMRSVRLLGK